MTYSLDLLTAWNKLTQRKVIAHRSHRPSRSVMASPENLGEERIAPEEKEDTGP